MTGVTGIVGVMNGHLIVMKALLALIAVALGMITPGVAERLRRAAQVSRAEAQCRPPTRPPGSLMGLCLDNQRK